LPNCELYFVSTKAHALNHNQRCIPAVLPHSIRLVAFCAAHNLCDSAVDNDLLLRVRVAQLLGQLPLGTRSTAWHQGAGERECLLSGHDTSLAHTTPWVARTVAAGSLVQPAYVITVKTGS
jgi:hypothetical protein